MKCLIALFISLSVVHASPERAKMTKKLEIYNEAKPMSCLPSEDLENDEGIVLEVACNIICTDQVARKELVSGAFVPRSLGMKEGNGSFEMRIIWNSLTSMLKVWSSEVCLERAKSTCRQISKIESAQVNEIKSGNWKLSRFPSCQEIGNTLSPFDSESKTVRINSRSTELYKHESWVKLPLAQENPKDCQKWIRGNLCFGDCVDISKKDFTETLSTNEPLGKDEVRICADELVNFLQSNKVSKSVKESLCEGFFWKSYMTFSTNPRCAAARGVIDCSEI